MLNRRGFLSALAGAFVAPDPEKMLWVPGKKLISIPKRRLKVGIFPPFPLPDWYVNQVLESLNSRMIFRPRTNRLDFLLPFSSPELTVMYDVRVVSWEALLPEQTTPRLF